MSWRSGKICEPSVAATLKAGGNAGKEKVAATESLKCGSNQDVLLRSILSANCGHSTDKRSHSLRAVRIFRLYSPARKRSSSIISWNCDRNARMSSRRTRSLSGRYGCSGLVVGNSGLHDEAVYRIPQPSIVPSFATITGDPRMLPPTLDFSTGELPDVRNVRLGDIYTDLARTIGSVGLYTDSR